MKSRRATRGTWEFKDGVATCTQDDELYKKHKDHGPIIFYDLPFTDATLKLSFKAKPGCKSVVFTANGEGGHVFRFVSSERGTTIRAYPKSSADHTSVELARGPALKLDEWIDILVQLQGGKATIRIGPDFEKVVEHPDLASAKTNFSIGYAFSTFSVRGVEVTK